MSDRGLVLPVGEQVGDDPGDGGHREDAHDAPCIRRQVRPDPDVDVVAPQPPTHRRVELVHIRQQIPQLQHRRGRAVAGDRVRFPQAARIDHALPRLQPGSTEVIEAGIGRASSQAVHPGRSLDPLKRAIVDQTVEVDREIPSSRAWAAVTMPHCPAASGLSAAMAFPRDMALSYY